MLIHTMLHLWAKVTTQLKIQVSPFYFSLHNFRLWKVDPHLWYFVYSMLFIQLDMKFAFRNIYNSQIVCLHWSIKLKSECLMHHILNIFTNVGVTFALVVKDFLFIKCIQFCHNLQSVWFLSLIRTEHSRCP